MVGDTVRFTVEARGEGLTYQWQSNVNGGKDWGVSGAGGNTTASMTVKLQTHNPGYLYRCKITDANGM